MWIGWTQKEFIINHLREYHDLYIQSDALLLADGFENFQNMSLETYDFDLAHFLSASGLSWQAALKKEKSKIRSTN